MLTLYATINNIATKFPNDFALNYLGRKISYKDLDKMIISKAFEFNKMNIKKGDIITICLPNIPNVIIAIYALNYLGATVCIIHPLSTAEEIKSYMKTINSKTLITLDLFYEKMKNDIDEIDEIILCRVNDYLDIFKKLLYNFKIKKIKNIKSNVTFWNNKLFNEKIEQVKKEVTDTSIIMFSGGTVNGTGKAICLSDYNFNALADNVTRVVAVTVKDTILAILPLFHGFGLGVCIHTALSKGATSILIPRYSSKDFIDSVKKYKPNYIAAVPFMIESLIKTNDIPYERFLKDIFVGGEKVPLDLKNSFLELMQKRNGTARLREGYGLTETVTVCMVEESKEYPSDSIGSPLPNMEFKVIDEKGKELPAFKDGEICVSGPQVMNGYFNNEDNEGILVKDKNDRVWLHTGDLGYKDDKDNYYFKQRIKQIIRVSGINVFPSIVESVISEVKGVDKCAVVGVKNNTHKEIVKAFIQKKENYDEYELKKDILELCNIKLNKWSIPKEIEFIDNFPITKVGKIDKNKLKQE